MRIILTLILLSAVAVSNGFHLQHQAMRMAVCRRAPPCCPGHVCIAYQRMAGSRPVAMCARSPEGRPLYIPGSEAQQRACRMGTRGGPTAGMGGQPLQRIRGIGGRGSSFEMDAMRGQGLPRTRGNEGDRFRGGDRFSMDQRRMPGLSRFPGPRMMGPGQDIVGLGQRSPGQGQMQFPSFDATPQQDMFAAGFGPEQMLGGQPNTFAPVSGQQNFGQSQMSVRGRDSQMFNPGQGQRAGGSRGFSGSRANTSPVQSMSFSQGGFDFTPQTGQFDFTQQRTQFDFTQPRSSMSGPSFDGQSIGGQSFGGQSFGGQSFDNTLSGQSFNDPSFSGGQGFSGQEFGSPSFGSEQGFGGPSFGHMPVGGGRRGVVPMPFLAEEPSTSVTPIGSNNNGNLDQVMPGSGQSQMGP